MPNNIPSMAVPQVVGTPLVYPTIQPLALGAGIPHDNSDTLNLEGFLGDGDYIVMPGTNTDTMDYHNNAGTLQWTVARTAVHASAVNWCGFHYDKIDDLIYMVACEIAGAPNTYYLATVNQAGTVVQIGSGQPSVEFGAVSPLWNTVASSAGASQIQREKDGSGNIYMSVAVATGTEVMVIDITDGSIVSDPANITLGESFIRTALRTLDGIWMNWHTPIDTTRGRYVYLADATKVYSPVAISQEAGISQQTTSSTKLILWNGYVAEVGNASGTRLGPNAWGVSAINTFCDQLKELL